MPDILRRSAKRASPRTRAAFSLARPEAVGSYRAGPTLMPIPPRLLERIATFRAHLESYLSPDYKEARLREEFLNPLFDELGWDITNRAGYAEAYKDVVHEDALKISGVGTVAPDFSFRIGGTRKFFVEAKKPSVRVKDDPEPAAQLRRYSFSAKLPLGIVTDFHEFAIYDGRVRYREGDKASTARLFYCTFEELPQHWDFIAGIFSRDAVLRGGFDKFAAAKKGKRGTAEFDDEFLKDLEQWRALLARNLALRNSLSQRDLNFAVQRILDRIIFLRIAEDRGVESFGQLQALTAGHRIYPRFCDLCRKADLRYNSGLFHFEKEKGRDESPDSLTLGLELDDATLKEIISALYYPKSPFAFAVIPADILGHVYEKFLGKVIHLAGEHRIKIEEKPEVRKAGGVYYTPTYIVKYIVEQAVGPLVAGKTPKQVEKLRVLDPACGSGSFLLGAFEFLLDWHLRYYLEHDPESWAKKKHPPLYETAPNAHGVGQGTKNWQLTTTERKRILLNNLYGVDIDAQAVEVTKLSLLLKVLEGEARELQGKQMNFERVLPDLGKNIKCGNSLIGSDFYAQPNLPELDDEARYKLNAFDWQHEFADIMAAGGFDAVIGNPPYVRIQTLKESAPTAADYLALNYRAASVGNYDLYVCFVERGRSLLNATGVLGFILPHKFFNAEYGQPLRALLAERKSLRSVVHFGANQVFDGATTYCCLIFVTAAQNRDFAFCEVKDLGAWRATGAAIRGQVMATELSAPVWNFAVGPDAGLTKRLKSMRPLLGEVADIFVGLQTSADDVFILRLVTRKKSTVRVWSDSLNEEVELEEDWVKPVVSGTDVQGYPPLRPTNVFLFPYRVHDERAELVPLAELKAQFPQTADYLSRNRARLEGREGGKFRGEGWHRYGRSQNLGIQERSKLCVPRLVDRLCAAADLDGNSYLDNVDVGGVTIKPNIGGIDLKFLLGILNSQLAGWFFPKVSAPFRGGWISANRQFLSLVPIAMPSPKQRDTLVSHVERMLQLHEQLAAAKSPDAQVRLQRDIAATDRAIDQLVYRLYDLTPDEIALVEAATAPSAPKLAADGESAAAPALPAPADYNAQAEASAAHRHFHAKEEPPESAKL